jgi:hypothetical protein
MVLEYLGPSLAEVKSGMGILGYVSGIGLEELAKAARLHSAEAFAFSATGFSSGK